MNDDTTQAEQAVSKTPQEHYSSIRSSFSSPTVASLTFSRAWLADLATANKDIAEHGFYVNSQGLRVDIKDSLERSIEQTKLYHFSKDIGPPTNGTKMTNNNKEDSTTRKGTKMYICYSHIIKVALSLKLSGAKHVGILNSANGYNPGGKFGTGCLSLEASICRGSLLWSCLKNFKDARKGMYRVNNSSEKFRQSPSSCAIFTPDVPLIRIDSFEAHLLDDYETASFVSIPPPNAFVFGCKDEVRNKLREHLLRALYIFAENECTDIVLCTYGCGTRGHDPCMVSEVYHELLTHEMKDFFSRVIIAINPKKPGHYEAFADKFESII